MQNCATTFDQARAIEGPCCFWIKNSDTCANIKIATATTVAALTAISLLGVTLLFCAKSGYNLHDINIIASHIEFPWLCYAGTAALIVGIMDCVVIASLARSYLDRFYTQVELRKLGILDSIESVLVADKLLPNHFWPVTQEAVKSEANLTGSPAVYAIVIKDQQSHIKTIGFKTEVARADYVEKHGLINGEEVFKNNPQYTTDFLITRFGQEHFQNEILNLKNGLTDGHFRLASFAIPGEEKVEGSDEFIKVHVLVTKPHNHEAEFHYYKNELDRQNHPGLHEFVDHNEVKQALHKSYPKAAYAMEPGQRWSFKTTCQEKELFAVAYREPVSTKISVTYFIEDKDARQNFLDTVLKDFEDAERLYEITYTEKDAKELALPADWKKLKEVALDFDQLSVFKVKTVTNGTIYTLITRGQGDTKYRYFIEEPELKEALQKVSAQFTDVTPALIELPMLQTLLSEEDWKTVQEIHLFEKQYALREYDKNEGKGKVYVLLCADPSFNHLPFDSIEARAKFVQDNLENFYSKDQLTAQITKIIKDEQLERKLIEPNLYYSCKLTINKTNCFVLLRDDEGIYHDVFLENKYIDKIIEKDKLIEVSTVYKLPYVYTERFVESEMSSRHQKAIKSEADDLDKNQFATFDVPGKNKRVFYTIVLSTAPKKALAKLKEAVGAQKLDTQTLHFSNKVARTAFINQTLKNYSDAGSLYQACFGVPHGMITSKTPPYSFFHLRQFLVKNGDSYTFQTDLSGKSWHIRIYNDKNAMSYDHYESSEKCEEAIRKEKGRNLTEEISLVNPRVESKIFGENGFIKQNEIEKKVAAKLDCWVEEIDFETKTLPVLFYHDGQKLQTRIFLKPLEMNEFINKRKLKNVKPESS